MHKSIEYLSKYNISITEEEFLSNSSKTVVVGMSGGVDSSVAAFLIKSQGYKTIGMFMKNWEEIDDSGECSAALDYDDVISVCERLDIPYYAVNFSKEYRENVFQQFLDEYSAGFTPNPDILCNREIKFKVFYDYAIKFGANYLATGHYCQKQYIDDQASLVKGNDSNKDQTYFLYTLQAEVLNNVLFPLGHLPKNDVRTIAEEQNLSTFDKKDSTGICFIGERNFKNFLSDYLKSQKGNFVKLEDKKIMGPHDGHCFYTIGQRKGLGIGGPGGPWFVVGKEQESNTVYVVEGEKHPALFTDYLIADQMSWVGDAPKTPVNLRAKVRYRQDDQECTLKSVDGRYLVEFERPQRGVAVKQSVVFYSENICLGGGVIEEIGPTYYAQNKALPVSIII